MNKCLFQLDDEPNLYIGNGWKSPFPSTLKWLSTGFQVQLQDTLQVFFGSNTVLRATTTVSFSPVNRARQNAALQRVVRLYKV